MRIFACRWSDGDTTIIVADSIEAARAQLQREGIDRSDGQQFYELRHCLLHLNLEDNGEFKLEELGVEMSRELYQIAYPILHDAFCAPGFLSEDEWDARIERATAVERDRLRPKGTI